VCVGAAPRDPGPTLAAAPHAGRLVYLIVSADTDHALTLLDDALRGCWSWSAADSDDVIDLAAAVLLPSNRPPRCPPTGVAVDLDL
jgi:hypothetical protein